MATRDIFVSLLLTLMFIFLISELFNENSDFSLIEKGNTIKKDSKLDNDKKIQDSIDILLDVKNNL